MGLSSRHDLTPAGTSYERPENCWNKFVWAEMPSFYHDDGRMSRIKRVEETAMED